MREAATVKLPMSGGKEAGGGPYGRPLQRSKIRLEEVGDGLFFAEQFLLGGGNHLAGKVTNW
jgi:hypothetical protein